MRKVTLYGRPECHLCDEARGILQELIADAEGIEMKELNIEDDDALFLAYLERIPVIELDGVVVGELVPDRTALETILLNTPAR